ncbi:MAG: c-type cytochrome [Luteolibacter sp.]
MRFLPAIALSFVLAMPVILEAEEFDAVQHGKKVFESNGCNVCHAVDAIDDSVKTGPNLFGRFGSEPSAMTVIELASGKKREIEPDKDYFVRSVRDPAKEVSIATEGPFKGQAYPPAMPAFTEQVIDEQDLEALWHYVRTLARPGKAGPAVVMMQRKQQGPIADLISIKDEIVVAGRPRVYRARLRGLSGRVIHVGLPNHLNYSFDPQQLSVRRVWSGGFLNLKEERTGRGGSPSALGHGAKVMLEADALLAPLNAAGKPVDFSFKENDEGDVEQVMAHLNDRASHLDKLAAEDAEFLAYTITRDGLPCFHFRVGASQLQQMVHIGEDGLLRLLLYARAPSGQSLQLRADGLEDVRVRGGELNGRVWRLPAGHDWVVYELTARLPNKAAGILPVGGAESLAPQPLVKIPARQGRLKHELPAGYTLLDWYPPLDPFGRKQLFEPTGIDVAKDGTIVIATRAAGVWRIRDGQWTRFAEGTYDCLGVHVEDDHGDQIVVAQKPELTRMTDTDGDGRADRFDTLCDDFGFHANYHEYLHGPARDAHGNYYFTLNLSHGGRAQWGGGQGVMGSMGGYRGWACRVTPEGKFEPVAGGLRSPAGIGVSPDNRVWYAENQGDFVGSSKLVTIEKGAFYGHVGSMVSLPGKIPGDPELTHDKLKGSLKKGAVWLPQSKLCNSPGHPTWDLTGGKFGPYAGQMFIGDQTQSRMMRVVTEVVEGQDQGCVMPFVDGLASGAMRPCFLHDGSMLIGQTGRGWGAKGGSQQGLQQIIWNGETIGADLHSVRATREGFEVLLTQPLKKAVTSEELSKALEIESWYYINQPKYGSPETDKRKVVIGKVDIAEDRAALEVELENFGEGEGWVDRIYQIQWKGASNSFEVPTRTRDLRAYYTLRAIPGS